LHGLATPGILLPYNGLVDFTGAATLPIGGAVLALSALPSLRRPRNIRRLLALQAVLVAAIAVDSRCVAALERVLTREHAAGLALAV
jgi:hypothetical protein